MAINGGKDVVEGMAVFNPQPRSRRGDRQKPLGMSISLRLLHLKMSPRQ